jgi:hypothetical protein
MIVLTREQLSQLEAQKTSRNASLDLGPPYASSEIYQVIVSDSAGKMTSKTGLYASAAASVYRRAEVTALAAGDVPDPSQFPSSGLSGSFSDSRAALAGYVEVQLLNEGWPWKILSDRAADSVTIRYITRFLYEPPDRRRARRVAYMIGVADSTRGHCRHVSVRWLTQSKGEREGSWTSLAADSSHDPVSRRTIAAWLTDLEPCAGR